MRTIRESDEGYGHLQGTFVVPRPLSHTLREWVTLSPFNEVKRPRSKGQIFYPVTKETRTPEDSSPLSTYSLGLRPGVYRDPVVAHTGLPWTRSEPSPVSSRVSSTVDSTPVRLYKRKKEDFTKRRNVSS